MKLWKIVGLAGLAGVAATGVVIARDERRRAQLTPQQVRDRLQQRLAEIEQEPAGPLPDTVPESAGRASTRRPRWWRRPH